MYTESHQRSEGAAGEAQGAVGGVDESGGLSLILSAAFLYNEVSSGFWSVLKWGGKWRFGLANRSGWE